MGIAAEGSRKLYFVSEFIMVHEPVLECSFLIPIRRDAELADGEAHKQECWDWLETELYARFSGFTVAPGTYTGAYKDPDTGQQVSDKSIKHVVAVAESRMDELRRLLSESCDRFQQKCIYLSVAGKVEFIEAPTDDST
jgi:hypothetical protein